MKATLIKIKKNLQGTISGGEEAGIQINDLEYKKEINIQLKQQEKKSIKQGYCKEPLWHLQTYQYQNHRGARRRRGRARNCKSI